MPIRVLTAGTPFFSCYTYQKGVVNGKNSRLPPLNINNIIWSRNDEFHHLSFSNVHQTLLKEPQKWDGRGSERCECEGCIRKSKPQCLGFLLKPR